MSSLTLYCSIIARQVNTLTGYHSKTKNTLNTLTEQFIHNCKNIRLRVKTAELKTLSPLTVQFTMAKTGCTTQQCCQMVFT